MDPPDKQLVLQALKGDLDSFNRLVERHQGAVYGLAYHWTKNLADAQDIAQDAFLLAYEKLEQLKEPDIFLPWLYRIALNACRKWQRNRPEITVSMDAPVNQMLREDLPHPVEPPEKILEAKEQQIAIREILGLLSDKVRLTTTLFYIDGLSYQEIGRFLGVPVSTVRSRLHKARKQLQKEAIQMVEEVFGKQKDRPKIEIKQVSGYLHVHKEGYGILRRTAGAIASPDDIHVPPNMISLFDLKQGDFVQGYALPAGPGETYCAALRVDQINHKPAVTTAQELKTEMGPRYSPQIQEAKQHAKEEATRLRHEYVGTEHLLLGLLKLGKGKGVDILKHLEVGLEDLKQKIEEWVPPGTRSEGPQGISFTPRAEEILRASANEAGALGHNLQIWSISFSP